MPDVFKKIRDDLLEYFDSSSIKLFAAFRQLSFTAKVKAGGISRFAA